MNGTKGWQVLTGGVLAVALPLAGPAQARAAEAPAAVSEDAVVARIGETTYTLADFRRQLGRLKPAYRYAAERRFPEYATEFVEREVLAREARRRGLDRSAGVQAEIEEATRLILIRALFEQLAAEAIPGPEEVLAYYRDHQAEFGIPERVEVEQLLVPTETQAEAIRAAVAAGQAFDAAATAPVNIAVFERGQREPQVERAVFGLEAGELSAPVRARNGVYLFRLRAHLPAGFQSLEGATPVIQTRLSAQNRERLREQLKDRLWATEKVVIREDLLKAATPSAGSPARAAQVPATELDSPRP